MEFKGGPYDQDLYGSDMDAGENAGRGEERESGYGYSPYSQSSYGQSPYSQSPYQSAYGDGYDQAASGGSPYSREYAQSAYGRESYGSQPQGRGYDVQGDARGSGAYDDQSAYGRGGYDEQGGARGADVYGSQAYGRGGYDEQRYGQSDDVYGGQAYGRGAYDEQRYGQGGDAYGGQAYGRGGYDEQRYGQAGGYDDYQQMSQTGRLRMQQEQRYGQAGNYDEYQQMSQTGRLRMQQEQRYGQPGGYGDYQQMSQTGRLRMQREDPSFDAGADDFTEAYDDEYEDRSERPKKKKKRSKVARFFHGLGLYIAELPAKTLALIGGGIAVVLVGVILLVMLLPKAEKTDTGDISGQISLSDLTPTPSLPPTEPPEPTDELPPEPTVDPDPLKGVTLSKVGELNDAVPAIQERLVALGYMEEPAGGYTTKFGPATKTAVRVFQIKNIADYKRWDGVLGAETYNLLMSDTAKPFFLARGDGSDNTSEITWLVEQVKKLQDRLIVLGYLQAGSSTGRYSEGTVTAIRAFQQYHGLEVDGTAGPATLELIYSSQAMDAVTGAANDRSKITPTPPAASDDPAAGATTPTVVTTPDPAKATPGVSADGVVIY